MKNLVKFSLALMILVPFSCNQDSLDITDDGVALSKKSVNSRSTENVFSPIVGLDPMGTSTLLRNKKGITVNFKTNGLTPGHAYTLWWIIFNNPEKCTEGCNDTDLWDSAVQADALYASGHVVASANGTGNFSAHLNEGDRSESIADLFFLPDPQGLIDAQTAEIHMVIRSHGPAVPGIVNEQIGSYLGGCPTSLPYGFPPFSAVPVAVGECGDIIAAVHMP